VGLDLAPAGTGLLAGLVPAALVYAGERPARLAPAVAGFLLVALVATTRRLDEPLVAVAAVLLLGILGAGGWGTWWRRLAAALVVVLLGWTATGAGLAWLAPGALLAIYAATVTTDRWHPRLLVAIGGITVVGTVLAVPDTEEVLTALGVLLPLGLVGMVDPARLERCAGWAAPMVALGWCVTLGAAGRAPAAIGGWGCFGLLLVLPIASLLVPTVAPLGRARGSRAVALVGIQVVVVLVASRLAPRSVTAGALVVVGVSLVLAGAALVLIARERGSRPASV
jgi:hypothetical protein